MFKVPEQYRITKGELASDFLYGNNGAFKVFRGRTTFLIIASDGMGWEHVSVHCLTDGKERTPTWSEMCFVKDLFWSDDDCVIQYLYATFRKNIYQYFPFRIVLMTVPVL